MTLQSQKEKTPRTSQTLDDHSEQWWCMLIILSSVDQPGRQCETVSKYEKKKNDMLFKFNFTLN